MNSQIMTFNNAVTSIRPTDSKLHFGHWIGNISSLIKYQDDKCCYFIFADLQMQNMIANKITDESVRKNMISMMKQMLNLGVDPNKVIFAIESEIKKDQLCNVTVLSDYLTNSRLNRIPLFKQQQSYKMSMSLFPILQALDFLITRSNIAFSNKDNKSFIELINEIFKKVNTTHKCNLPHIDLITGVVDFLCGYDGCKMGKTHNNCIFLDDTYEEIKQKVNKMYTDPNRICGTEKGNINNNVVFKCLRAFSSPEHYEILTQQYTDGEISDTYTKKNLTDSMYLIAKKSQSDSICLSDNDIWDLLLQGSCTLKENSKYLKI